MFVLLSNDDGVHAPGLAALYRALEHRARLRVVAPDRDQSGASSALTLSRALKISELDNGFHSVDGTPADCVYLGVSDIWPERPDMVVSGINRGANLGDDVLYSGTVAAAREGRSLGHSAIAISLVGHQYFETAGRVAAMLLDAVASMPLPPRTLLNVNVPDLPFDQLEGIRVTHLGRREGTDVAPISVKDPRGVMRHWIGPVGRNVDEGSNTDFAAIAERCVSITPMGTDLTQYDVLDDFSQWLSAFSLHRA